MQGSAQDAHHSSVPSGSFVTGNTVTPMHGRWVLPEDAMMLGSSSGPTGRRKGRKKVPPVDLSRVTDPEERKRQRRLMKNRETAAASRCVVSKRGLPLPEELAALPASDLTTPPSLLHRATPLQLHQDQSGGRSGQLQYSSSLAPSTADPQPAAVGRSSPPSPGVHAELAQDGPLALYTPEKQRPIFDLMGSPFEDLRSPPADRPPPRAPVSRVPPDAPESRVRDPVARVLDPDTTSRVGSDLAVAALVELGHSPPKPPAARRWEERAAPAEEVPVWLQGAGSPSILKKKRSSPRQRGQLA
ncbi:hypothetical protein QBZ16_003821 [Prototheca wickerhamii]|uniref:Uncharacterized protein n=1 Tax=Prototheca wickerhamii TaxID=3111 RepID=A0AAD9II34_PROWI|nr:hypothetical protein QBZ16_003821 [Prototheca wickerhamii]